MNSVATVAFMCLLVFLACHETILSHGIGQSTELQKRQAPCDIHELPHIWSEHIRSSQAPVEFCETCKADDVPKFKYIIDDLHKALDQSEELFTDTLDIESRNDDSTFTEFIYDAIKKLSTIFKPTLDKLHAMIEKVDSCSILTDLTNSVNNWNSGAVILHSLSRRDKVIELPDLLQLFTYLIYNLMEVFQTTEYMRLCLAHKKSVEDIPTWGMAPIESFLAAKKFRESIARMSYLINDIKALQTLSNDDAKSVLEIIACGILRIHENEFPPECNEFREPPIEHNWNAVS